MILLAKKWCLNLYDYRVSGKCYICDREELNQLIPCDLCQKDITLYNTLFCDRGLNQTQHTTLFCQECGIVQQHSLVYYCSAKCQFQDSLPEELAEYLKTKKQPL